MIELPPLFSKNADNSITQWSICSDGPKVITTVGKLNGKMVVHKTIAAPTNVGRANQRNAEQQAEFEAKAAWTKKQEREGYFQELSDAQNVQVYLPMLAQKFNPKKIRYPATASYKLNGLRLLTEIKGTAITLRSRTGVVWDIPHISECVRVFAGGKDALLDGEVYIHGVSLQNINSLVKNEDKPERLGLQYHLYDLPLAGLWEQRWEALNAMFHEYSSKTVNQTIHLVTQRIVNSDAEVKAFEREAILQGYEGIILRFHGEPYGFNQRPKSMMKLKSFADAEFTVIDMRSRVYSVNGKDATICDVCVCKNNLNERTFEVMPRGTIEQKMAYWTDRANYIGQKLVVRFLERSDDGVPQGNPVGIAFRLEGDTPLSEPDKEMWD